MYWCPCTWDEGVSRLVLVERVDEVVSVLEEEELGDRVERVWDSYVRRRR